MITSVHLHIIHGVTHQKVAIVTVTATTTSNLTSFLQVQKLTFILIFELKIFRYLMKWPLPEAKRKFSSDDR